MIEVEFRVATCSDIDDIYRIEKDSFSALWSKELFASEIENDNSVVICAFINSEVIGFVCFMFVYDEIHLSNIAVDEKYRKKGIGSALLNIVKEKMLKEKYDTIFLEVRVSNTSAISLYEKFGFKNVGIRRKYYSDNNEDAVIMCYLGV